MYDELTDAWLDERLRDVSVPAGLIARLKEATVPNDEELDHALQTVQLPVGFTERLHAVVDDIVFDEALTAVVVPTDLLPRLRVVPQLCHRSSWKQSVMAASLLFVILTSYFGAVGAILASMRPRQPETTSLAIIDLGPITLQGGVTERSPVQGPDDPRDFGPLVPVVLQVEPLSVDIARLDAAPSYGPAGALMRDLEQGLPLADDVFLLRWGALGSPQTTDDPVPELEHLRKPPAAGVDLPLVPGYDRSFLLKRSTHPPIFPHAQDALEKITVPLTTSTDSVDRTRELLAEDRLPDPLEVHTQDFLSALDYRFPAPDTAPLGIHVAAGPSLFGRQPHSLLQIGVKAMTRRGLSPTHVSLVMDVSTSMRGDERLGAACDAIRTMLRHMGPEDSLSLVNVNHVVTHKLSFVRGGAKSEVLRVLGGLEADGGDNLGAGMARAMSLALQPDISDDAIRQVVVVTDGRAASRAGERERMRELLAIGQYYGVATTILEVGGHHLTQRDLTRKLIEIATNDPSLVAKDVRLQVTFNPRSVLAYRLVGHGPTAVTGLAGTQVVANLHSGEEATALFEVWLRDNAEDDIAWTELRWIDAEAGTRELSPRELITRSHFSPTQHEASVSLQAAAVAAELGQRLRGVPDFTVDERGRFSTKRKSRRWTDLLAQAGQIYPPITDRPDFKQLLDLVRDLARINREGANE